MSSQPRKLPTALLGLRDFLRRAQVVGQYRNFMRELQGLDPQLQTELRKQIRDGFARHKSETDKSKIKAALTDGTGQLAQLRKYAGSAKKKAAGQSTDSTWVGTGEPDDIRGRIGNGWPWGGGPS